MTRAEFEEKSFEDVMSQFNEELDEITTLDRLKEFAKLKIDEGNYLLAGHIIEALQAGYDEDWWNYDYCMGTLDTPIPLTGKTETRRGRVGRGVAKTLTTAPRQAIYYDGKLRMLTSKEHLRLMGFKDKDYNHMKKSGLTDQQISYLAGNSICIPVLMELYKKLMKLELI